MALAILLPRRCDCTTIEQEGQHNAPLHSPGDRRPGAGAAARRPYCRALAGLKRAPAHDRNNQAQDYVYQTAATQQARALGSNATCKCSCWSVSARPAGRCSTPTASAASRSCASTGCPIARQLITSGRRSRADRHSRRAHPPGGHRADRGSAPPALVPASLSYSPKFTLDAEQPAPACAAPAGR